MDILATPKQARSRRTHTRILDAAEHLLEGKYFDDISVGEIAARAGVSVGNVYARFGSKDALLLVLHDRYEADRTKHLRVLLAGPGPAALKSRIDWIVCAVIELFRARRGVLRSLILRYWRDPAQIGAKSRRELDDILDRSAAWLLGARGEITHADAGQAVRFGLSALLAAAREAIILRPQQLPGALEIGDEALAAELAHMLHAYLTQTTTQRNGTP